MSIHRWLAGVLLFALGCGAALLIKVPAVGAASQEGVVEGNLKYVDGEDFRLIYPSGDKTSGDKTEYLVVVSRAPGTMTEAPINSRSGLAVFSKKNLERLTVYRVVPVLTFKGGLIGKCDGEDYCPLPPPPPPPDMSDTYFKSGPVP